MHIPVSLSPPASEEIKSHRKITILNTKIHDLVKQIDNINMKDQEPVIRKM